ncbi:MAG: DUF4388 domain-containing protein [Nannocystaceae bacterium]
MDEPTLQAAIDGRLTQEGHRTAPASNVRQAIERLRREPFDIVICDLHAAPGDGAELLQWLGSYYPSIPVIVLIEGLGAKAKPDSGGSVRIVEKPVDLDVLVEKIEGIGRREGFFSNAIEIELFDYVQMMAITGRDKHILVTTRLGTASIWFEHGDISHAQFLSFRGEDAFYRILTVGQGVFRETLFRPPPSRTVMRSSTHLLMEAARLQDEGLFNLEEVEAAAAELEASRPKRAPSPRPVSEAQPSAPSVPTEDEWAATAAEVAAEAMERLDDFTLPTDDDEEEPFDLDQLEQLEQPEPEPEPEQPKRAPMPKPRAPTSDVPRPRRPEPSDGVPVMRRKVQTLERVISRPHTQPQMPVQPAAVAPRRDPPKPKTQPKKANDLFDDPETREALLGQFWQYEGVDGVAIISSTGKVMAEDMRNNSTAVTLAGFFMRGAARMARMLGYNVFDGVIARSKNGQQIIMIGMGATSAVLSVDQEHDPDAIRDDIMGVEGDR